MAMQRVNIGTLPDGSPHWHYFNPDGGELHVVYTGRAEGPVDVEGVTYDVTAPVIEVQSHDHAIKLARKISDPVDAPANDTPEA